MDSSGRDQPSDVSTAGGAAYGWLKGLDAWLFRSMAQVPRHPVDAIVVLALMRKRRRRLQKERPRRVALTAALLIVPWALTAGGLWPLSLSAVAVGTGAVAIVVVGLAVHRAWWERRFRSMVHASASRLHGGG